MVDDTKLTTEEDSDEPYITAGPAQKFLGLSTELDIRYCKQNQIPFFMLGSMQKGRRLLFRKSLLEKWMANNLLLAEDRMRIEEIARIDFQTKILTFIESLLEIANLTEWKENITQQYTPGVNNLKKDVSKHLLEVNSNKMIEKSNQDILLIFEKFMNSQDVTTEIFDESEKYLMNFQEKLLGQEPIIQQLKLKIVGFEKNLPHYNINVSSKPEILKDQKFAEMRKLLMTDLEDLTLSVRAYKCFKAVKIKNLAEIVHRDTQDLLKLRNFGRRTLVEIEQLITEKGLYFGMDISPYLLEE